MTGQATRPGGAAAPVVVGAGGTHRVSDILHVGFIATYDMALSGTGLILL